jgi:hypothetical protein
VRGADLSLNHGAGRRMVRFDHIAVMGICGLNAVDTLWLQISLLITMRNNGGISSTPAGCVPSGAAGRAKDARSACVMAGLVPQVGFTRLAALKWVRNSGRPELRCKSEFTRLAAHYSAQLGPARVAVQSIPLRRKVFRRRWMRGSKPAHDDGDNFQNKMHHSSDFP